MPESSSPMFTAPDDRAGRSFPTGIVLSAGFVVAFLIGVFILLSSHRHPRNPNQVLPLAPDAAALTLSHLAMSESTSLSGGKSTFIDGQIANRGSSTVTGVTVQVLFGTDETMPPHLETTPLALIRTREPYIDTEPVSAAPLHPGETRDFRLIFEALPSNWNGELPAIHIVGIAH